MRKPTGQITLNWDLLFSNHALGVCYVNKLMNFYDLLCLFTGYSVRYFAISYLKISKRRNKKLLKEPYHIS